MDDSKILPTLIGGIYDASLDLALWPRVLNKVNDYTPGVGACLFAKDVNRTNFQLHQLGGGIEAQWVEAYEHKYIRLDPLTSAQYVRDVGEPQSVTDILSYAEFLKTTFFKEWVKPQGIVDFVGVTIERSSTTVAMFGVFRRENHGLVDEPTRHRIRLIAPHVRRAVAIGQAIELKSAQASTLLSVLDSMAASLFLIDGRCRIVHGNASGTALLQNGAVARREGGRLILYDAKAGQDLLEMLGAAAVGDGALGTRGIAFPIAARDGEGYVGHVLPLTSGKRGQTGRSFGATAMLLIQKVSHGRPSIPEVLVKMYSLTTSELRILIAIAEIGGVPEVAEAFGISETTVKFHLKNLFEKTGARRQADLVKLLAGFNSPLVN